MKNHNQSSSNDRRGRPELVSVSESVKMTSKNKKKRNMKRLGGEGLTLQAFANSKSLHNGYNPALKKKKREFYRNSKFVNKYRKTLKHETKQNDIPIARTLLEEGNDTGDVGQMRKDKNRVSKSSYSLKEIYERKHAEEERARIEREAIAQAKREEIEKSMARRKAMRAKMLRKTASGQPVMKHRLENLLQNIQGSKV